MDFEEERARGFALCRTTAEVEATQAEERARAAALCDRISDELAVSDPSRSAELAAAAASSGCSTCELYRYAKEDGRVCSVDPGVLDLYLIIGQSNALGSGTQVYYVCTQTNTRMWIHGVGWCALVDPAGGGRGSMAPRLADYLRANGVASVGIFIHAVGGTNSNEWVSGSTNLSNAIDRTLAALAAASLGSTLRATIVYQGETNVSENNPEDWQPDWDDAFDAVATALAAYLAPDYQEVIVRLPEEPLEGTEVRWEAVRTAQEALATARGALIVQAPVATLDSGLHLDTGLDDSEGQRALGVDIGAALTA